VSRAVNTPEMKKRLEELGYVAMTDTPQDFAKFLHEDIERMGSLIKQYNLKPE
jgi:tripartite-type tricarboxylate transporter receptor subunit TctC